MTARHTPPVAADLRISGNTVGQEGPTYSPDGTSLWMPQMDGFARFPVNADGSVSAPTGIPIPALIRFAGPAPSLGA